MFSSADNIGILYSINMATFYVTLTFCLNHSYVMKVSITACFMKGGITGCGVAVIRPGYFP